MKIKNTFTKKGFELYWVDDSGLRMQKQFTELFIMPETDRIRISVHDDGMGLEETDKAAVIAAKIALEFGYRQGTNIIDPITNGTIESDDEYYKYF